MAYVLGGFATFGAAFLPGNTALYRVVCAFLGLIMAFWALKVLLFGGTIFVSVFVLVMPVVLIVRGVTATVRWVAGRRPTASEVLPTYLPPPTPHPATRQFTGMTEPGYHPAPQPHPLSQPPQAYTAPAYEVPAARTAPRHYVPQPQFVPDGYATVHHQYPAVPQQRTATPQFAAPQHGTVPQAGPATRMPVAPAPRAGELVPRMPRAPLTEPAPLPPGAGRARHRAADA